MLEPQPSPEQQAAMAANAALQSAMNLLALSGPLAGAGIAIIVCGQDPTKPMLVSNMPPQVAERVFQGAQAQAKAAQAPQLVVPNGNGAISHDRLRGLQA